MDEISLVDRREEMQVLKEAVSKARDGRGGILFLLGEPGIGKTRLAKEVENYARSLGMRVLSGRCPVIFQVAGVAPYSLWVEVVKDYLNSCSTEMLQKVVGPYSHEISMLVPGVAHRLEQIKKSRQIGIKGWIKGPGPASDPHTLSIGPENERLRLLEAVSQFIENVSREKSCLVVLDDLQWADQSSLLLFHYLGQNVFRVPLVFLGIYRNTEIHDEHPLRTVLSEFERQRLSHPVLLKRLSFEDSVELIKRHLHQQLVPPELGKNVYEKTGGNPYFIEEVLRSLTDTASIRRGEEGWEFGEIGKIRLPDTVRELVRKRLGRLGEDHLESLTAASIIGKEFSFEALNQIAGIGERKLLTVIDDVLHAGLIEEQVIRGKEIYVFSDILVREVIYDSISRIRRRKLHGAVAKVLERTYADEIDDHLVELAYHYLESDEKARALEYLLKAGERAMKVYAYAEASSHFTSATEIMGEDRAEQRADLLETLGDIRVFKGEYAQALEGWTKALEFWKKVGEPRRQVRLHTKMSHVFWDNLGDRTKASQEQDRALRILENQPESSELANLYNEISWMLWRFGDTDKAKEFTEKAFSIGKRLDDNKVIAQSYGMIGGFERDDGKFENWTKTYETMLELAIETSNVQVAIIAYDSLASANWDFHFKPERAEEYWDKALELSNKVGYVAALAHMTSRIAWLDIDRGEYRKAIRSLEENLVLQRKIDRTSGSLECLAGIARSNLRLGDLDVSQRYLEEELDASKKSTEFQSAAFPKLDLGISYLEREEYAEARACFEESLSVFKKSGFFAEYEVYLPLAEAMLATGDYDKASEIIAGSTGMHCRPGGPGLCLSPLGCGQ